MSNTYKKGCFGIIGIGALVLGALFLPVFLFGDMIEGASRIPGAVTGIIFTVIGIFFCTITVNAIRKEKKFNYYAALIEKKKSIPLAWLAKQTNRTIDAVIEDLREAISNGRFSDAHIDEKNGYLLFPNSDIGAMKSVNCPNCGAAVEVMTGYFSKCPFCGNVIDDDIE